MNSVAQREPAWRLAFYYNIACLLAQKSNMRNLKTFVYFDLEATGLRSSGRPRITEISLKAVNVDDTYKLKSRIEALQMCGKSDGTVLYVESL